MSFLVNVRGSLVQQSQRVICNSNRSPLAVTRHGLATSQRRQASTETSASTSFASLPPAPPQRPLVRTTFLSLTFLGVATTAIGIYLYFNAFSSWPEEVRNDLRTALKSQKRGDVRRAEAAYRRALETAQNMAPEKLGAMPILKISGISIALGSFLEEQGNLVEAYKVYEQSLQDVKQSAKAPEERMRAVTLAQRCGDLAGIKEVAQALSSKKPDLNSLAEEHLEWSVEELLRLAVSDVERAKAASKVDSAIMLADLELPSWVSGATLGASLEALGQLYARQGRSEYAIPIYIQCINLLMPANKESRKRDPTVSDRCQTGILMNNIAQLLVDADKSKAKVDEATSWALKGLDIVAFALRGTGWDGKEGKGFKNIQSADEIRSNQVKGLCWTAEVALLINLAELARMKEDDCKAREVFQKTYLKADQYGIREVRSRAAQALSELERTMSKK